MPNKFNNISTCETTIKVWNTLVTIYDVNKLSQGAKEKNLRRLIWAFKDASKWRSKGDVHQINWHHQKPQLPRKSLLKWRDGEEVVKKFLKEPIGGQGQDYWRGSEPKDLEAKTSGWKTPNL